MEETAPAKKFETDFFLCSGILLVFAVICAVTIGVVMAASRDITEVVGPLRKP